MFRTILRDRVAVTPAYAHYVPVLLESYAQIGGRHHSDLINLIVEKCSRADLRGSAADFFPGFHDDDTVQPNSLPALIRARLVNVAHRLEEQVRRARRALAIANLGFKLQE